MPDVPIYHGRSSEPTLAPLFEWSVDIFNANLNGTDSTANITENITVHGNIF